MRSFAPLNSTGALVGALLMAAALGLMGPLAALLGLTYAPHGVFAWLTRNLPGGLIIFGLESLLGTLNALGLPLSQTGKLAQGIMASGFFLIGGAVAGYGLFDAFRRLDLDGRIWWGLMAGGVAGGIAVWMSASVSLDDFGASTWGAFPFSMLTLLIALAWAGALIWSYNELARRDH